MVVIKKSSSHTAALFAFSDLVLLAVTSSKHPNLASPTHDDAKQRRRDLKQQIEHLKKAMQNDEVDDEDEAAADLKAMQQELQGLESNLRARIAGQPHLTAVGAGDTAGPRPLIGWYRWWVERHGLEDLAEAVTKTLGNAGVPEEEWQETLEGLTETELSEFVQGIRDRQTSSGDPLSE